MNATNASFHFENSAPRFTSATFRIYLDKLEWKSHLDHLHILWFIAGPAMWTTNLIGIALNAVIVLLGLFFSKSVTGTLSSSISLVLIMRAVNMLLLHDMIAGKNFVITVLNLSQQSADLFFVECRFSGSLLKLILRLLLFGADDAVNGVSKY